MEIIPSVILFAAVSANCMAATVADSTVHNMSVDCDCDSHPADPKLKDMGILASTDPVALDQACLNLVFNHKGQAGDDEKEDIRCEGDELARLKEKVAPTEGRIGDDRHVIGRGETELVERRFARRHLDVNELENYLDFDAGQELELLVHGGGETPLHRGDDLFAAEGEFDFAEAPFADAEFGRRCGEAHTRAVMVVRPSRGEKTGKRGGGNGNGVRQRRGRPEFFVGGRFDLQSPETLRGESRDFYIVSCGKLGVSLSCRYEKVLRLRLQEEEVPCLGIEDCSRNRQIFGNGSNRGRGGKRKE